MKAFLSGIRSKLTELRPLLACPNTATAGISSFRGGNTTTETSTQTKVEAPAWKKLYRKEHLLGCGGNGSVFAGERRADGMPVAIKFVDKILDMDMMKTSQGVLPLEVALMQMANSTQCSNILQLLDWFDEPSKFTMILERPEPCQDVSDFCKALGGSMDESLAKKVTAQLIKALLHCKTSGVFHRDVKPENLLIQTDTHEVKLFDFGSGDVLRNSPYYEFSGTRLYVPPEYFLQHKCLAEPATVWSVGITLYKMLCGVTPFSSIKEIINGQVYIPEKLSKECCQLIRWCLKPHAADRPTLEQIKLHPWFQ